MTTQQEPRERQAAKAEPKLLKTEWIERAPQFGAERFEVAGALFDVSDHHTLTEKDVARRLTKYRGGV